MLVVTHTGTHGSLTKPILANADADILVDIVVVNGVHVIVISLSSLYRLDGRQWYVLLDRFTELALAGNIPVAPGHARRHRGRRGHRGAMQMRLKLLA